MTILRAVLLCAIPVVSMAQPVDSLSWKSKLSFHAESALSPASLAGAAAYAGILQADTAPEEWGQSGGAYGKRVASTVGYRAIRSTLAFGLDSTLHQDPRYLRSRSTGFWRRTGHALRGTIMTRIDSGGEKLAIWRLGSAYGAAYLSNQWYPDRLNTARLDAIEGSLQIGLDFAANLGAEFWPDVKRKILHRKAVIGS